MDKLKELLVQIGGSEELVGQICEELDTFEKGVEVKYEKEFKARLGRAKQVCLEEVETEKSRLARKVEIYLESQANRIKRSATKKLAIEEAEAVNKLRKARKLLEGVDIGSNNSTNQAKDEAIQKLKRANATMKEDRSRAVEKANEANRIARKMLNRNQLLESRLKGSRKPISESRATKPKRPVAAEPQSTRRTLKESQVRAEKPFRKPVEQAGSGMTPSDIANKMELI